MKTQKKLLFYILYPSCNAIEARRLCGALSLVLLLEVVVAHVGGEPNSDNKSVRGQAGTSGIGLAAALV
jgi:hypothetical protein